jgi:hypothetical protein
MRNLQWNSGRTHSHDGGFIWGSRRRQRRGTSVNHVCETADDPPHANTVWGYLIDQFDLDAVEAIIKAVFQQNVPENFPDQPVKVVANLHLNPYYDDKDETPALYWSQRMRNNNVSSLS